METYYPTVMWGHNILDSIFAVRRAMALNSDFESANLKYATRFLDLKKPNRVYVPGNEISTVWHVESDSYAFNDENGNGTKLTKNTHCKMGLFASLEDTSLNATFLTIFGRQTR